MISFSDILISAGFVAAAIIISFTKKLKLERDIVYSAIRAFVQLMAAGYILKFIFAQNKTLWTFGMILVMSLVGAWTSSRRAKGIPKALFITTFSMFCTVAFSLAILLGLNIIDLKPMYLIPVAGMVIGNNMNALSLCLIRFRDSIDESRDRIEAALALGKSPGAAISPSIKKAIRISMIPRIDTVKITGLIHLPGAMTGMILAGASPIDAVKFQIVIMYIILGSPFIAVWLATETAYKKFFTPAEQLFIPTLQKAK